MRIVRHASQWGNTSIRLTGVQSHNTIHSQYLRSSWSGTFPRQDRVAYFSHSGATQPSLLQGSSYRHLRHSRLGLATRYARVTPEICHRTLFSKADQNEPYMRYSGDGDDHNISPEEYTVRIGKAIRTLRQELPQFFDHGLCNTSIYASNIRLIEASHTNVSLQGKTVYFLLAGAVRWSFKMWFRDLEFEIQSIRVNDRGGRGRLSGMSDWDSSTNNITQVDLSSTTNASQVNTDEKAGFGQRDVSVDHGLNQPHVKVDTDLGQEQGQDQSTPPSTTVTVRWTLKGTTRPSVVLTMSGPTAPPPSTFAGVFVYEFDDRGLMNEHRIENIMPSPSPEAIQRAFAWWGWLLSRTRPAAATSEVDATRKRLGLGCFSSKQ